MTLLPVSLALLVVGLGGLVAVGLLIYVIANRIRQYKDEDYPDRKH